MLGWATFLVDMSRMDLDVLVSGLLDQLTMYSSVHRKSTQPFTRKKILNYFPDQQFDFDHEVIRETLLEHVGCLPIIAAFLHPYLEKPVDLGKALIMLAVHDIGELTVGDELVFLKGEEQGGDEYAAAMELLHDNYKSIYKELDDLQSNEARFVKSIDKLAPDLFDYLCEEKYTIARVSHQAGWPVPGVIDKIRAKKRPFMLWSRFLTDFHDVLFARFSTLNESLS